MEIGSVMLSPFPTTQFDWYETPSFLKKVLNSKSCESNSFEIPVYLFGGLFSSNTYLDYVNMII